MTTAEMIARLTADLKTLSSKLVAADFVNAVADAEIDTGYTAEGNVSTYELKWLRARAMRHLFSFLRNEAASKFKVDGINLQQRFEHYDKILEAFDLEWEKELESAQPGDMTNIGGLVLGTGIVYDRLTGHDITDLVE